MNTHQEVLINESEAVQTVLAALEGLKKNVHKEEWMNKQWSMSIILKKKYKQIV